MRRQELTFVEDHGSLTKGMCSVARLQWAVLRDHAQLARQHEVYAETK